MKRSILMPARHVARSFWASPITTAVLCALLGAVAAWNIKAVIQPEMAEKARYEALQPADEPELNTLEYRPMGKLKMEAF